LEIPESFFGICTKEALPRMTTAHGRALVKRIGDPTIVTEATASSDLPGRQTSAVA
jgi:hypothetical protein